jgi:hypothetical protein
MDAKTEIVTAVIIKEIHRFSMPSLLAAAATESKGGSLWALS